MIFYGSRVRTMRTDDGLSAAAETLVAGLRQPRPIERHAKLIEALILAGELAQGVADAAFLAAGYDDATRAERAVMAIVHRLAVLAGRSWDCCFENVSVSGVTGVMELISAVRRLPVPEQVEIRQPEGYAHYAVYPESYWTAAKSLGLASPVQVIGIRSIGSSLSAMVSAALGADVPLTVRPVGHPFAREIRPGPRLEAALRSDSSGLRAVVDEGPGLSGSSFGAVADALERRGTLQDQVLLFPSHANGPGIRASPRHMDVWRRAGRHVVDFDALVVHSAVPAHRLDNWVGDLTGPPLGPMLDLAAGHWRRLRFGAETAWPPCDAQNERRKFLLHTESGLFLLKFAGLGASGRCAFTRAQVLAGAGFSLAPLGLRHGFMVERWRADLRPLDPASLDRAAFLRHLGAYLVFRACTLPAEPDAGASIEALYEMTIHNANEALGKEHEPLGRWRKHLAQLSRQVRRVQTDNRLHAWEWLVSADGRWIKTDAVDHCMAHDLVGCQDLSWDAAGAAIEFDLKAQEEDSLLRILDRGTGRAVSRELFQFCRAAYAAYQLGAFSMARDRSRSEDAHQLGRASDRYAGLLRQEAHKLLGWSD